MSGKMGEIKSPEDFKKMTDEELIHWAQVENDVINNDSFSPLDILIREYAISELERRGYRVSYRQVLVIEKGDEE